VPTGGRDGELAKDQEHSDQRIAELRREIERLRVSDDDPAAIADEIDGLEAEIHRVEEQRELAMRE